MVNTCLNYVSNQDYWYYVNSASEDMLRLCPNDAEAIAWEEVCQLRYSGRDFISHLDVTGNIWKGNVMKVSRSDWLKSVVNTTLWNLKRVVAFDPWSNMCITGTVEFEDSSLSMLCALVQYRGYLFRSDCSICPQRASVGKLLLLSRRKDSQV